MTLLSVKNLCVDFKNKGKTVNILKNVTFSIEEGEFAALVGESGSGKTITSLSCMNLLPQNISVTSGSIEFIDCKPAMIFQDPLTCLNPLMKVGKQIEEAGLVKGMSKEEAHKQAVELAKETGLLDTERIFNAYPHELSGGMRQRIMIAMALMNNPKLLIADEPTTALDVTTQEEILNLIKCLNSKYGTSLLLITHDFTVVKKMCTKLYVMYKGEIVETGSTEKIIRNPQHPYTKALLDSIPSFSRRNEKLSVYTEWEI